MTLPNCTMCRARVQAGQPVRFTDSGRTQHIECPPAFCPVCRKLVESVDKIVRDGERLRHVGCAGRLRAPN